MLFRSNLNYSVSAVEAYSYRNSTPVHEYIFDVRGSFESNSSGQFAFSVLDASGATANSNAMSLTGVYEFMEFSEYLAVNQTAPLTQLT